MSDIWVVRAGRGSVDLDLFMERSVIAIGFSPAFGERAFSADWDEMRAMYAAANPKASKGKVSMQAGQVYRFCQEMQIGDPVLTYDPGHRRYYLGRVAGKPVHDPEVRDGYSYFREVQWTERVLRDAISLMTRNSLGAIMTLFRLKTEASEELRRLATPIDAPDSADPIVRSTATPVSPPDSDDDGTSDLEAVRDRVVEQASEFIEDALAKLEPYAMQDLVAGILRSMGYKTNVSPPGPDRGVDIMASPDGLGLQEPRIFVEVKHRPNTAMGSQQVRTFLGGRQPGDRCLYVSTGGFTKDARYEGERSNVPLTLLGLPDLRRLLVEHYEDLDVETKQMVPLTRVYWPVAGA